MSVGGERVLGVCDQWLCDRRGSASFLCTSEMDLHTAARVAAAAAAATALALYLRHRHGQRTGMPPHVSSDDVPAAAAVTSTPMEKNESPHIGGEAPAPAETAGNAIEPAAPAAPSSELTKTDAVAELSPRVERLVDELKPTIAGSESRRTLVLELLEALQEAAALPNKGQRKMARVFVDCDGPEVVYEMESCMRGDWVADAKNGTMRALSKISRLGGPVGQAMLTYRGMREKAKTDAAHGNCEHKTGQGSARA